MSLPPKEPPPSLRSIPTKREPVYGERVLRVKQIGPDGEVEIRGGIVEAALVKAPAVAKPGPGRVKVGKKLRVRLGAYETAEIEVSLELPVPLDPKMIDRFYNFASQYVSRKVNREASDALTRAGRRRKKFWAEDAPNEPDRFEEDV